MRSGAHMRSLLVRASPHCRRPVSFRLPCADLLASMCPGLLGASLLTRARLGLGLAARMRLGLMA